LISTRQGLHRLATHIVARRRFEVCGRFGLRASPGGFMTAAFGDAPEVIRVSGLTLVREVGGEATYAAVSGSTLRDLATFAAVNLGVAFSAGEATPTLGDIDLPLDLDSDAAVLIADWLELGWRVLDRVAGDLPEEASPATIQLWPEHFDAGTHVGVGSGARVNLGFSPGDEFEAEPYAYVGPWTPERGGDPAYWNAPFGAVLRWSDVHGAPQPAKVCVEFLRTGLRYMSAEL